MKSNLRPIRICDYKQLNRLLGVEKLIWIAAIEGLNDVLQNSKFHPSSDISPLQDITTLFCLSDENQINNEVGNVLWSMSYEALGQMDLEVGHCNARQERAAQLMMRSQGCDDNSSMEQCLEALPKAIAYGWQKLQETISQYPNSATRVTPLNVFRIMPEGPYEGGLEGNEWETDEVTE